MAGRYRALLIGNSTYPADEHNLQTLKGPVKDIAAVNRALIDPSTGLFADVDVTLLPETTSTRAIRALGRFFGTADRDDVLLFYFSGHGKLDHTGRLHLCMQDTETTDLLSTAVSSARIKEFADASHARNVVIVLDCCYAGAFRGGDLGDTVAGPGRYVLTSCRGTQLANDATVENGTSFFTQHLVDGLVGAAADQDRDGYITFSDLYAYVNRRLREAGKQIPQRRVDGDGDVTLAKRPEQATAGVSAMALAPGYTAAATGGGLSGGPAEAGDGPAAGDTRPAPDWSRLVRGRGIALLAATAAVIVGGVIATLVLLPGGSGGNPHSSGSFSASGNYVRSSTPWRLKIQDHISVNDNGCTVTLTGAHSSSLVPQRGSVFTASEFQLQAGSYRWRANNSSGCIVTAHAGPGMQTLPFSWQNGDPTDTLAFAEHGMVAVQVLHFYDPECTFILYDASHGQQLDSATATQGASNRVMLDPGGPKSVYLGTSGCAFLVSAS